MNTRDYAATNELLYLYCVTETLPLFRPEVAACDIQVIEGHGLYAVVGRVSSCEFSEETLKKNLYDVKWVESRVLQQHKIVQETMANCTVIPFKFATIFKTEEKIKVMLEEHDGEFREILEELKGREEWGIKLYCDIERLKASLEEAEEIRRIEDEMSLASPGKMYFLRKKKDSLIKGMLTEKIHEYGMESFEILREQSRDARINKPLPKEATLKKDDMIMNAAFLVDKTKITGFIGSIEHLKERYSPRGLDFDCTGPWPPYNFCSGIKEIVR